MPRKKLTPDAPAETAETPTRRARSRKAAETVPAPAPVEAAPAKPKRAPRKKTETLPIEAVASEPVIPDPVVPEPVATEPVAEAPKRRTRSAKAKTTAEAPVTPVEPEKPKRAPRKKKADTPPQPVPAEESPVAPPLSETAPEPEVETAPVVEAGGAYDLGDGRQLLVEFRPSARAAKPAEKPENVNAEPVAEAASEPNAPLVVATFSFETSDEEPLPTVTFRPRSGVKPAAKAETTVAAKPVSVAAPQFDLSEEEMPLISWRPKGSGTPTPDTEETDETEAPRSGRRDRDRDRGRERGEEPVAAKPEPPKPVVKPPLAIPPDAPQVVLREGVPVLVRDGRAFPALAFGGDPTDQRNEARTYEQVRMAAADGVHLHVLRLPVEVDASAVEAVAERGAQILSRVAEADPEAQTILLVEFLPGRDADRRFPDAFYRGSNGRPAEPSVCDDGYWGEALRLLTGVIDRLKGNPRLMGLQLDRGWLHPETEGYDTSKAAVGKFQSWARTRYGNDIVALRAAWFDGAVRFDSLTPPSAEDASDTEDRFIRAGRRQRRVVDYHLFLSDATAARVGELARAVKEASAGCMLVGVEYGQTLEGNHPAGGHLALGKIMRTPEIDFVAVPPSYEDREAGGTAAFPTPVDSFPLNGKLVLSVEDYRTSLGGGHYADEERVLRTPQALESVHWRGVGAALAHGMGVAWTDAGGEGSLRSNSVWDRANRVLEALTLRIGTPMGDPEVAVFIDERALAYLVDADAFQLLVQSVRESILRAGVSAAFYLLSDLAHRERFPDSKLYVFLNAWDIRPDARAAIKTRLQRDGKVLFWIYAAGLFDAGRDSLERAREVTGIALKPQPFASRAGTTLLNRRHPLAEAFPERTIGGNDALEPTYFAIPEDATVLGEYTQTGLPSFVVRDFGAGGPAENRWTSVFLGEPKVTPALVRSLAQMAGAHVWDFSDDVVHVRPPFLTIHCRGTGARAVSLPAKEVAYDLVARTWATVDGENLRFIGVDGTTHAFLVGPRAEIEHLLAKNPADTLKVESLPPRELNVRQDASDFDVPIMALGEFIGSAEGDEAADEWFLRPDAETEERAAPAPAQAAEAPGEVGKRRRRRGGRGRDRDRDERPVTPSAEGSTSPASAEPVTNDDFGISVVFRKRQ